MYQENEYLKASVIGLARRYSVGMHTGNIQCPYLHHILQDVLYEVSLIHYCKYIVLVFVIKLLNVIIILISNNIMHTILYLIGL